MAQSNCRPDHDRETVRQINQHAHSLSVFAAGFLFGSFIYPQLATGMFIVTASLAEILRRQDLWKLGYDHNGEKIDD